jgi:tetratricopeptide (TPR) repeat protein
VQQGHLNGVITSSEEDMFDRGLKQLDQGKLAEAAETFYHLKQKQPLSFKYYFWLGGIYNQMGKHQEAAAVFEKTLSLFPLKFKKMGKPSSKNTVYPQFHYARGTSYLQLNRFDEAAAAFKQVLKSKNYKIPNSSLYKKFYPACRLTPNSFYATVHYNLGIAYLALGNRKAALEQFEELKKLDEEKAAQLSQRINK